MLKEYLRYCVLFVALLLVSELIKSLVDQSPFIPSLGQIIGYVILMLAFSTTMVFINKGKKA